MRHFLILLLVSILFLIGCNDKGPITLRFTGESNHWKCEYIQKAAETWTKDSSGTLNYQNSSTKRLNLKYKGTDISNLGLIKYSYDAGSGGGSGETSVDKNGYVIIGNSGGKNSALTRKDEIIVVTIEWKGQKETIKLTNE